MQLWNNMASARFWIRMRMEALALWQMPVAVHRLVLLVGLMGDCDQ